jgi:hypothetical protein
MTPANCAFCALQRTVVCTRPATPASLAARRSTRIRWTLRTERQIVDLRRHFSQQRRVWHGQPGASEADLSRLSAQSSVPVPPLLLELLRFSNGGEGPLALPPLRFVLDDVDFILSNLVAPNMREAYPGMLFFGSNGGLESIAFDTRGAGPPWPIVMLDQVAGNESAVTIARDLEEFLKAVGLEAPEGSDE